MKPAAPVTRKRLTLAMVRTAPAGAGSATARALDLARLADQRLGDLLGERLERPVRAGDEAEV